MNKSGSTVILGLMLGMVIIILALALAPVLQDTVDEAMSETSGDKYGLDCNNESISSFDKAGCIAVDLSWFYYLGALLFIGGLVITSKITFG